MVQDSKPPRTYGSALAERHLTEYGYRILSYEGTAMTYVLTRERLLHMPYNLYWGLQQEDPTPYIGEKVAIEKFIIRNHPLDTWGSGGVNSKGRTEAYVYIVGNRVVGGTSYPVIDTFMAGGYWSLHGRTLEELTGVPFQEWRERWDETYRLDFSPEQNIATVTTQQLKRIKPDMTYQEVLNRLGSTRDIGSGRYIMIYGHFSGKELFLNFGSYEERISDETMKQIKNLLLPL